MKSIFRHWLFLGTFFVFSAANLMALQAASEEAQSLQSSEPFMEETAVGEEVLLDSGEASSTEQAVESNETAQEFSDASSQDQESEAASAAPSETPSGEASAGVSAEIDALIQNGEWLKAREALLQALSNAQDLAAKDPIERALSEVNMKLILSKEETPQTIMYRIRPGDSLYVIAKKFKTSIRLIQLMNGLQSDLIRAGAKLKILKGNFSITVSKSDNVLRLFLGDQFFRRYHVATGATSDLTPVGSFTIVNKLENPTWFKAGVKAIPPGSPENELGSRWLGFSKKGYGIHGTIHPDSIGQNVTSGCIRMLNNEVEELFNLIPTGTKVTVMEK